MHGEDSIRLSEGFQANGVAFGPGNNQLNLTSWTGVQILDLRNGKVTPGPSTDVSRSIHANRHWTTRLRTRLVATSLDGRVEVAKSTRMQEPAEPVVFRGSIGTAQFSPDGQRLLILSGGTWNMFDTMRLIDVSPLYRTQEAAPENSKENLRLHGWQKLPAR